MTRLHPAWRLSAVCLVIFLLVAVGVTQSSLVQRIDRDASESVYHALPLSWCEFLSWWGHSGLYVLGGAVAAVLLLKRQWVFTFFVTIAVSGAYFLQAVIKTLTARPRPVYSDAVQASHSYSFPSAHTLLALILYGLLMVLILRRIQNRKKRLVIAVITAVWVILIGISRVVLGFHYLGDILGSVALGLAWSGACIGMLDRYAPALTPALPAN